MTLKEEMERIEQIIEQVATQYATDENGVFHLQDYVAFKAGYAAGLAVKVQLEANSTNLDEQ